MKKTPWFKRGIKPIHVGVYEVYDPEYGPTFQHWNGKKWGLRSASIDGCLSASHAYFESYFQENKWRGLSEKPKGKS